MSSVRRTIDDLWNGEVDRVLALALDFAAVPDDAGKAAGLLAEEADRGEFDPVSVLLGCRWALAGRLDHAPDDLTALVALGVAALAGMGAAAPVRSRRITPR